MVPCIARVHGLLKVKVKVKGHVIRALLWCHVMFAIQYRLTFCLYMHSLSEVRLHCPSTISVRQPDVMSTSWNELLRRFRCVRSPLTWCINFSFVHLQYITSYVRSSWWSLVIVRDNYSCLVIIILLFFFLPNEVYRTSTKPVQVWTPSGPKNTDPVSVTLKYFSRSQTHFCAKNPKFQIHITSSLMIGFWWNLVRMDNYTTPCWYYFSVTLTYFFRSNSKSARNILSPVWPNLDVLG